MRVKKHLTEVLPRSGSLKNNPDSVFKRGDLIQVYEPYEGYMLGQYMGMLGIVMETFTDNISIYLQTGDSRLFSCNCVFLVQHKTNLQE